MPIADPSLPKPDSLTPPKGTTQVENALSLTPTCETMRINQRSRKNAVFAVTAVYAAGGPRAHAANKVNGAKKEKQQQSTQALVVVCERPTMPTSSFPANLSPWE